MTSRPLPYCVLCANWRSPLDSGNPESTEQTCSAFPGGIPDQIWWNQVDHRNPYPGDGGIHWEPRDGAEFPEWVLEP